MKSSNEQLKNRGFIQEDELNNLSKLTINELVKRSFSEKPSIRTASIRLLSNKGLDNNLDYVLFLLNILSNEKSLYTKIELCKSLEKGNEFTANLMCKNIGDIGKNQHKSPKKPSKKNSYPLPRDIIARTLSKMDKSIINILISNLNDNNNELKISELLDAIGFLTFYNSELAIVENFNEIKNIFFKFKESELITWKICICCSAFPINESKDVLKHIKNVTNNENILLEVERSLKIISG